MPTARGSPIPANDCTSSQCDSISCKGSKGRELQDGNERRLGRVLPLFELGNLDQNSG